MENQELVKKAGNPSLMPDIAAREKFVLAYCKLGRVTEAAIECGMSPSTGRTWIRQPWFEQRCEEVKKYLNNRLSMAVTGILEKTLEHIDDRLTNGELRVEKKRDPETGDYENIEVRRSITVKDLTILAGIMVDKRAHLLQNNQDKSPDIQNTLDKIANQLRNFKQNGATDVEVKDGIDNA